MKRFFYKNIESGEVFEYESLAHFESAGAGKNLVEMIDDEVAAHLSPPIATRDDVEVARLIAYADPVSGSDRYKAEAYAERIAGNDLAADAADAKMIERREEIRKENPWPKDSENAD